MDWYVKYYINTNLPPETPDCALPYGYEKITTDTQQKPPDWRLQQRIAKGKDVSPDNIRIGYCTEYQE